MSSKLDLLIDCEKLKSREYIPKLLVGVGPRNCSPRVIAAFNQPTFTPTCNQFYMLIDEIQEMLRYVFQTTNKVTLGIQTSGTGGIKAALLNVVDPGETVIIGVCGYWGTRLVQIAKRANINVVEMKVEKVGTTFSLEELEKEIIKHKPVLLFLVHGESSLGVLQQLEGLGDICHKHNCLLGIDAIASLGCVPLYVDRWKIDIAVSSSNKALRGPPGIAYLTFNPRAIDKIRQCKVPPPLYYDILNLGGVWNCFETRTITCITIVKEVIAKISYFRYHSTITSQNLFAAKEGLLEILENGLEAGWEHYKKINENLRLQLQTIGCKPFLEDLTNWLPIINLFSLPSGINTQEMIDHISERHKVEFGLGIGNEDYLRIGLMGYNARTEVVDRIVEVLNNGIRYFEMQKL